MCACDGDEGVRRTSTQTRDVPACPRIPNLRESRSKSAITRYFLGTKSQSKEGYNVDSSSRWSAYHHTHLLWTRASDVPAIGTEGLSMHPYACEDPFLCEIDGHGALLTHTRKGYFSRESVSE